MKKFFAFFMALLMTLSCFAFSSTAYADDGKIEIRFKLGDSTLLINGKSVTVPTPYVVNGTTLVPLRVITEAFGAKVGWDGVERKVTLTYEDNAIELWIGSKISKVNGEEKELLEAPEIRNDLTMVPLRFITENFDATVQYIGDTKEVIVIKEPKQQDDSSTITGALTKDRIGDTSYGWSIDTPKTLTLEERTFDGLRTTFVADGVELTIGIYPLDEAQTLSEVLENEKSGSSGYTLINSTTETDKNGIKYAFTQYKSKSFFYDNRSYLKDGFILYVDTYIENDLSNDNVKANLKYADSLLSSFGDQTVTQDLSNVNAAGYRTYTDSKYLFSIDVPKSFYQRSSQKENSIEFRFLTANYNAYANCSVSVFSKSHASLEDWAKVDYEKNVSVLNPAISTASKIEAKTFKNITAVGYSVTAKINGNTTKVYDYYAYAGDYGYNFSFSFNDFVPNAEQYAEYFFNSLVLKQLDKNVIGKLQVNDPLDYKLSKNVNETSFSMNVPKSVSGSNGTYMEENTYTYVVVTVGSGEGLSTDQVYSDLLTFARDSDPKFETTCEKTTLGGYDAIKVKSNVFSTSGTKMGYTESYAVLTNGKLYIVVLSILTEYYNGSMYRAMVQAINTFTAK